jgi:uncharacterized protein YdbL (DUF1318 family)
MKPNAIRQFVGAILLVLAFQSAWAIDIHEAKSQGLVGEANSGYLAAVAGSPSAEVNALISEVNQKRKDQFKRTAEKTGATLDQVRLRFYELAIERTQAGHYYQDKNGAWKQK